MTVFQYCSTCKDERVHILKDKVIKCSTCNRETKIK